MMEWKWLVGDHKPQLYRRRPKKLHNGKRERARRLRQNMELQQRNSHKNGTAVSRFLFAPSVSEARS